MNTNIKQVRWKQGRMISLKLRNGHYALLQMLERPNLVAVFNAFREKDEWSDLSLSDADLLFTCCLTKSVLKRSEVYVHDEILPVDGVKYEILRISLGGGFREMTVWKGTEAERTFLMMGDGHNKLRELTVSDGLTKEVYTPISNKDYEKFKRFDLVSLCDYPSFNERLYLCESLGYNIDPIKELAFNRALDPICAVYIDIISGKVPLSTLGY